MRAIGSLILKVSIIALLVIFIGILSMILSVNFTTMSIIAGVSYSAQYSVYGMSYNNCLNSAEIFGFNSSVCDPLLNVTKNTTEFFLWTGNYAGTLSNPILWAIIFTILTAGIYVGLLQVVQFGQNVVIVKD